MLRQRARGLLRRGIGGTREVWGWKSSSLLWMRDVGIDGCYEAFSLLPVVAGSVVRTVRLAGCVWRMVTNNCTGTVAHNVLLSFYRHGLLDQANYDLFE